MSFRTIERITNKISIHSSDKHRREYLNKEIEQRATDKRTYYRELALNCMNIVTMNKMIFVIITRYKNIRDDHRLYVIRCGPL